MADQKISELTPVSTPTNTNELAVNEIGVSKKLTVKQIQGGEIPGAIPFVGSTGVFVQDASNFFWDDINNRLGIGTNVPDGTLHVHTGSAGGIGPSSFADNLVVENNDNVGLALLSPDNRFSTIEMGSLGRQTGALIRWQFDLNLLNITTFNTGADLVLGSGLSTEAMRIKGSGNIGIGTSPSASAKLEVASTTQGVMPTRWTDGQETTNVAALGTADEGLQWFNTTSKQWKGWNGTAVVIIA